MKEHKVTTVNGSEATLWSDDTFTLHFGTGFDEQSESTPELLARSVYAEDLVALSKSQDANDAVKAQAALDWLNPNGRRFADWPYLFDQKMLLEL